MCVLSRELWRKLDAEEFWAASASSFTNDVVVVQLCCRHASFSSAWSSDTVTVLISPVSRPPATIPPSPAYPGRPRGYPPAGTATAAVGRRPSLLAVRLPALVRPGPQSHAAVEQSSEDGGRGPRNGTDPGRTGQSTTICDGGFSQRGSVARTVQRQSGTTGPTFHRSTGNMDWLFLPSFASHWTASSPTVWSLDKPPPNLVEGLLLLLLAVGGDRFLSHHELRPSWSKGMSRQY